MITLRKHLIACGALVAIASAACSGGSGSGPNPAGVTSPVSPASSAPAAPASSNTAALPFTFRFPTSRVTAAAAHRKPNYLSLGTQSFVITQTVGTASQTFVYNLNSAAVSCKPDPGTIYDICTTTIFAPVGSDTYSVQVYDQVQTSTTAPFAGNLLGTITTTVTVVAGSNTPVLLTLDGVPATVILGLPNSTPRSGTAAMLPLLVSAYDADGYLIIGTYTTALTLTNTDASGAAAIYKNGSSGGLAPSTTSSSDVFTIDYLGTALSTGTATYSGTALGVTFTSATLRPTGLHPTQLVFIASSTSDQQFGSAVYGYDLSSQTKIGTSTTQYQIAAPIATLDFCGNCNAPDDIGFGPHNEFVYDSNGQTGSVSYFGALPIVAAAPAPSATPVAPPTTAPLAVFSAANTVGSFTPIIDPQGNIYVQLQSNSGDTWARYAPGTSGTNIPAPFTVTFAESGSFAKFDPAGNFWLESNGSGLFEYTAAALASAANGATLAPATSILYGQNTAGLPSQFDTTDFNFSPGQGSNSETVILLQGRNLYFYENVIGTTDSSPATVFYNTLQESNFAIPQSVVPDPSGSGNVIVDDNGDQTLDYFFGPNNSLAPANNSQNVAPYKTVKMPNNVQGRMTIGH